MIQVNTMSQEIITANRKKPWALVTGASAANFPATTPGRERSAYIAAAPAAYETAADSGEAESQTATQPGLAEIDAYFSEL